MTRFLTRLSVAALAGVLVTGTAVTQVFATGARPPAGAQAPAPPPQLPPLSPSHLAVAKEVVIASNIAKSYEGIIAPMHERLLQMNITRPELKQDLEQVIASLQPEMELQKQRMLNAASEGLARQLTEAELTEIAAFFRSPAGKRYSETQPAYLADFLATVEAWQKELAEYIMVRARVEMRKRGHNLQ